MRPEKLREYAESCEKKLRERAEKLQEFKCATTCAGLMRATADREASFKPKSTVLVCATFEDSTDST
eukprot:s1240_g6.t1